VQRDRYHALPKAAIIASPINHFVAVCAPRLRGGAPLKAQRPESVSMDPRRAHGNYIGVRPSFFVV
jgi:hypothetical protein